MQVSGNRDWVRIISPAWRSRAVFFIRLAVGLIFLTQGVLKYLDPNMGVNRFTKIGFAHPYFTAHFVGASKWLAERWSCSDSLRE